MNKAIIIVLCFVAVASIVSANDDNYQQELSHVFQEVLSFDPISISQPFSFHFLNLDETISNITITGLSIYTEESTQILRNDVLWAVIIPKIAFQGILEISQLSYTSDIQATISEVSFAIYGVLSVSNKDTIINNLHTEVQFSNSPEVYVNGNIPYMDNSASQYLTSKLQDIIHKNNMYNGALNNIVKSLLKQAKPNLIIQ